MTRTFKQLTALLLALMLVLSCTGCNTNSDPTKDTSVLQTDSTKQTQGTLPSDPTQPGMTGPDETQPGATEPTGTEPIATEPDVTEPTVTVPPTTEPGGETQPPTTTVPPTTEITPTVPPTTEPSVTEPVVTEPPATESPAAQAPADDLNNCFYNENNNSVEPNAMAIKPLFVTWDVGGEYLVAECFVINGFDHDVYDIVVNSLEVYNADGLIASGSFGLLRDLGLDAGDFTIWRFVFNTSCVVEPNAALQTLTFKYNISNKY